MKQRRSVLLALGLATTDAFLASPAKTGSFWFSTTIEQQPANLARATTVPLCLQSNSAKPGKRARVIASAGNAPDEVDLDLEAQMEAERIMRQLEDAQQRTDALPEGAAKYMPSTADGDPVVAALKGVCGASSVTEFELLDSRWNGNEAFKYTTDRGLYFVKLNRVEDPQVFMTEAVSLSALAKTGALKVPKPLHIGKLPRVGEIGPGAFLILEWLPLVPFGPMRPENQRLLGKQLAALHSDNRTHAELHQGRFGFPTSNFLALTPLNNAWSTGWPGFFARRLFDQVEALQKDKVYGRAALAADDTALRADLIRVIKGIPATFEGVEVKPSLLHGDLWIGNTGATAEGPCMFDPASFFGHSEFDLAIMGMFGGFTDVFWDAYHKDMPKQPGHEKRQRLYVLYQLLNQLNLFGDPKVRESVENLVGEILADSGGED